MNQTGQPVKYYKSDNTKFTFRECWQIEHSWRGAILALGKVLKIRAPTTGIPWPARFRDNLINEAEISSTAREKIAPLLEQCQILGFRLLACQTLKKRLFPSDLAIVSLLHPNEEMAARIFFSQIFYGKRTHEKTYCVMVSRLHDGNFCVTSNGERLLESPPNHEVVYLTGVSLSALFDVHSKRLVECRGRNPSQSIHSLEDFEKTADALEESLMQFYIQRGLYVEMTPQEVESANERWRNWQSTRIVQCPPYRLTDYLLFGFLGWFILEVCCWLFNVNWGNAESFVRGGTLLFCLITGAAWFFIVKRSVARNKSFKK